MPTYEYRCSSCACEWEAEQRISEAAMTRCSACGQETAKRLISFGGGFTLKGGGWAADKYGSTRPR